MICVSAGHHPLKPGACHEGFCEHDEAVRWVDEICNNLGEGQCVKVPPTTLKDKVLFINNRQPDIAVEIHFNSAKVWEDLNKDGIQQENEVKNVGRGCCTLYYPGSETGKVLATYVQEGMEQIFDRHWNGVMEGYYRMNPKNGADYFLRRTRMPSIIIEPEFIHKKELIQNSRIAACAAITSSLLDYMENQK